MENLSRLHEFDWDQWNAEKIHRRHRVEPYECEEVFFNEIFADQDKKHSSMEERFYALGRTHAKRCLFIVFTIRHGKIRVLSARPMSRRERRNYYERLQKDPPV